MSTTPDPAVVKDAHYVMPQSVSPWNQDGALCSACSNDDPVRWPCERWLLADALLTERSKLEPALELLSQLEYENGPGVTSEALRAVLKGQSAASGQA
jgi:hypothetical protein